MWEISLRQSHICPICRVEKNAAGSPFASEWAMACHVAGIIRSGDPLHKSWAQKHAPEVDLRQSVPRLAEALMWNLRQAVEAQTARQPVEDDNLVTVLHRLEKKLHRCIQRRLQQHFGVEHDAWWRKGIPLKIRQECAVRREDDLNPNEPYSYTCLIHLKEIIDKNWPLFEGDLAKLLIDEHPVQKKQLLDFLNQVNDVRNRHSHPVRAPASDSEQYADDLQLARLIDQVVNILAASAAE